MIRLGYYIMTILLCFSEMPAKRVIRINDTHTQVQHTTNFFLNRTNNNNSNIKMQSCCGELFRWAKYSFFPQGRTEPNREMQRRIISSFPSAVQRLWKNISEWKSRERRKNRQGTRVSEEECSNDVRPSMRRTLPRPSGAYLCKIVSPQVNFGYAPRTLSIREKEGTYTSKEEESRKRALSAAGMWNALNDFTIFKRNGSIPRVMAAAEAVPLHGYGNIARQLVVVRNVIR